MDEADVERELLESQAALKGALEVADEARTRRQEAVMAARRLAKPMSKYKIAKVLGVERPTVDSIIKSAGGDVVPEP